MKRPYSKLFLKTCGLFFVCSLILFDSSLFAQEVGCIKGNCEDGVGTFRWPDGNIYKGQWVKGVSTGKGTMTFANKGGRYAGGWKGGFFHGKGQRSYADGSYYRGEFTFGLMNGNGTRKYSDGMIYRGDWLNNRWHGSGVIRWPDGASYRGTFASGKMVDQGEYSSNKSGKLSLNWKNKTELCLNKCNNGQGIWLTNRGNRYGTEKDFIFRELVSKGKVVGNFSFVFPLTRNLMNESIFSTSFESLSDQYNGLEFALQLASRQRPRHLFSFHFRDLNFVNTQSLIRRGELFFDSSRSTDLFFGYGYSRAYPLRKWNKTSPKLTSRNYGVSTGLAISRVNFFSERRAGLGETLLGLYLAFHYFSGYLHKSSHFETTVGFTFRQTFFFATNFNRQSIGVNPAEAAKYNSLDFSLSFGGRF